MTIAPARAAQEPRFRLAYGASDKLCVAQFNLLAARSPAEDIPVCDIGVHLPPDVQQPEWQEVDVLRNLEMMQRIEWELRFEIYPRPHEQFDVWFQQLKGRMKDPQTRPHLRRLASFLKKEGKAEFIYGYSTGREDCDPSKVRTWANYPGMRFFMYDEQRPFADRLPVLPGRLVLHNGQPYIFSSGLTDKTHFWQWRASISRFRALPETQRNPSMYYPPFVRNYKAEGVCLIEASDMFPPPPPR